MAIMTSIDFLGVPFYDPKIKEYFCLPFPDQISGSGSDSGSGRFEKKDDLFTGP